MIALSSDIAEGMPDDLQILHHIDTANVCCGAHAGSPALTREVALQCVELRKEVGAHPGYEDPGNLGRVETRQTADEIETLVRRQVESLAEVTPVAYIKPHGALYHRCQMDADAATALIRVALAIGVGVVGQPGFGILRAAAYFGVPGHREGFADRAYRSNGELQPRDRRGAVLSPDNAAHQAIELAKSTRYDVICIHGDTPGAADVARAVRHALSRIDIPTAPLRRA